MIHLRRYALLSAVCYLVLGLSGFAQSSKPFSLSLSAKPTVKAGSNVYVRVSMQNLSDKPIDCSAASSNGVDLSYRFFVRDESGNLLKKTVRNHSELEDAPSIMMRTLDPGQATPSEDNLMSHMYDLTAPGKYTIQASRGIEGSHPEQDIESNVITITVVP